MPNQHTFASDLERFLAKVNKDGPLFRGTHCWLWLGRRARDGYGQFGFYTKGLKLFSAHRYLYEALRGPIPVGLSADHLCRNTSCVNPDHIEIVDIRSNILRGTAPAALNSRRATCSHGHPFDLFNTRFEKDGHRKCLACKRRLDTVARERRRLVTSGSKV